MPLLSRACEAHACTHPRPPFKNGDKDELQIFKDHTLLEHCTIKKTGDTKKLRRCMKRPEEEYRFSNELQRVLDVYELGSKHTDTKDINQRNDAAQKPIFQADANHTHNNERSPNDTDSVANSDDSNTIDYLRSMRCDEPKHNRHARGFILYPTGKKEQYYRVESGSLHLD